MNKVGFIFLLICQAISVTIAGHWFDSMWAVMLVGTLITLFAIPILMMVLSLLFQGVVMTHILVRGKQ